MAENNAPNNINNPFDKSFKAFMGLKQVAIDCSKQFLPKDVLDKLDLDTFEVETTSYITEDLSEYFSDLVWRCRYKDGSRYVDVSLLYEHKSYIERYPHFQILDYIRGAWRIQIKQNKTPILMIPIVLYHGEAKWENESFDSYFGALEPEFLRFLPCFDYILVNLQNYSDKRIRSFESFYLQKMLLAYKHCRDKNYLKVHIVELMFSGFSTKKDDQTYIFFRILEVYLTNISGMSKREIVEEVNKSNNNLKSEAMSIFEEFIEEGIEIGIDKGIERGIERGIEKSRIDNVVKFWQKGIEPSMIANLLDFTIEQVIKIIDDFKSKM